MSDYVPFKRVRWIILSLLVWVVGCTGDGRTQKADVITPVSGANTQNQANTGQINNVKDGVITSQPQATIDVSSCGQRLPSTLRLL